MSYPASIKSIRALFFVPGILLLAACTSATTEDRKQQTALSGTAAETGLLQADEVLHRRLLAIQEADNQYVQLVATAPPTAALDKKSETITQAEIALQQTIDSLEQELLQNNSAAKAGLTHLTGYFKATLENRRALSDMRMVLSADSDDSTTMQQSLTQLRAQLEEKNKQIASLEHANKTNTAAPGVNSAGPDTYAPAKGESVADLRQRNKNLSLALNNLQVKYFVLGRDYLVLKKQHERTMDELATLRKPGNQK